MKKLNVIALALALQSIVGLTALSENQEGKPKRADIYDRKADGTQQIADALKAAKAENKRLLLKFGANWCGWCHKLSKIFKENDEIARVLKNNYVLVLIEVDQADGKAHNQDVVQRYGNPTQFGLPVLVVLDSDGKQLNTQDTGKLEEGDHHDPKKVMAFLEKWKPRAKS
jgi:thiol:disulfide interchange protein